MFIQFDDQCQLTIGGQIAWEHGLRLSGGHGPQLTVNKYDGGSGKNNIGLWGGTLTGNGGEATYTHGKFDVGYSYSEPIFSPQYTFDLGPMIGNAINSIMGPDITNSSP